MRELAGLYHPDVPVHENTAYVERTKAILASHEGALQGSTNTFGNRVERGWMPPSLDDEAALAGDVAGGQSSGE